MTEEFVEEDVKSLRTMIGRYGYQNLIKELENIEQVMSDEIQSMFKFNIFDLDGTDYIPIEDLVSFLSKLAIICISMINEMRVHRGHPPDIISGI